VITFAIVAACLGAFWFAAVRLLDAIEARAAAKPAADGLDLVRAWGDSAIDPAVARALADADRAALDGCYEQFRSMANGGNGEFCARPFEEALVSLVLAEAEGSLPKAYRALEAVRCLRDHRAADDHARREIVLDLIEARGRLVIAEIGRDPRQRQLAMTALARAGG